MRFNVLVNDLTIKQAAGLVEKYHASYMFLERVRSIKTFNYTKHTGVEVAKAIQSSDKVMQIKPYKTWNPFSKVIGYASGDTIWVNTRKLHLPLKDRVENLMHEQLHLLGYSHKGNTVTVFNLGTVPYRVGALFADYVMTVTK